jgi:DNA repair exonuclease SbcCD ATPase subunit
MRYLFLLNIAGLLLFSSCLNKTRQIEEQNRLLMANLKNAENRNREMEDFFESYTDMINSVQEELNKIEDGSEYMISYDDNGNPVRVRKTKENLLNHINELKNKLDENKELLNKLNIAYDKIAKLEKTVENLKSELLQKEETIRNLRFEVYSQKTMIKTLEIEREQIKRDRDQLERERAILASNNNTLTSTIRENELKRYCFIVTKKEQPDIYEVTDRYEIPVQVSYPKIVSNHPSSSYRFEKDSRKDFKLEILDYNRFWSNSSFLVIRALRD